jgi:SAM-dependent methyltransferase
LREPERALARDLGDAYAAVARLATTTAAPVDPEPDIYETLLDNRLLADHVRCPCRVLDIGPGAGRHLLNLALSPERHGSVYVGVESVGLPYALQNLAASFVSVLAGKVAFADYLDYEFARQDFRIPAGPPAGSIFHLPLWRADLVPDGAFDLILCNYLLDEVSAADFHRIVDLIVRALAPEGVVYCRGSQQRAMLKDIYLYGMGTFHQQDITRTLLGKGLAVKECRLIASTLTRLFVREDARSHARSADGLAALEDDAALVEAAQTEFVRANLDELRARGLRVAVWGEPGWGEFMRYVADRLEGIRLVALTNEHTARRERTRFGADVVPPRDLPALRPEAVIITSTRDLHVLRALRELLPEAGFDEMRRFSHPVAFAYARAAVNPDPKISTAVSTELDAGKAP